MVVKEISHVIYKSYKKSYKNRMKKESLKSLVI